MKLSQLLWLLPETETPQKKPGEVKEKNQNGCSSQWKPSCREILQGKAAGPLTTGSHLQWKGSWRDSSLGNSGNFLANFATRKHKVCQAFSPARLPHTPWFTELYRGRLRVRCQPLVQEHLLLTGVTPDPKSGQIHCQVVLFGLEIKRMR